MDLIGKLIMVKTRTKDDMFGDCLYKITGPVEDRPVLGGKTKKHIRVEMIGGTGPSARKGLTIWDVVEDLESGINNGTLKLVGDAEAAVLMQRFDLKTSKPPGNIIEL